jgi:hypothetical protein
MMAGLFGCQWKIVASQYQTGLKLTEVMLRVPANKEVDSEEKTEVATENTDAFRKLERQSAERVKQGLAPPKEIYGTPFRDRIDWSRFPEWARPSDPEVFEGCGHEG